MNEFGIPEVALSAGEKFPPGAMLFVKHSHGVALTINVVAHLGAVVTESEGYEFAIGYSKWLGWYSPKIASNDWEPCDQTHPAAYIPYRYNQLDKLVIPQGLLLRQRQAVGLSKQTHRGFTAVLGCLPGAVPSTLAELLVKAGVSADDVDRAVDFLYSDFAGETPTSPDFGVPLAIAEAHRHLLCFLTDTTDNPAYGVDDTEEELGTRYSNDLLLCGAHIARTTRIMLLAELSDTFVDIAKDTGDSGFARAGDALRRQLITETVDGPMGGPISPHEVEEVS